MRCGAGANYCGAVRWRCQWLRCGPVAVKKNCCGAVKTQFLSPRTSLISTAIFLSCFVRVFSCHNFLLSLLRSTYYQFFFVPHFRFFPAKYKKLLFVVDFTIFQDSTLKPQKTDVPLLQGQNCAQVFNFLIYARVLLFLPIGTTFCPEFPQNSRNVQRSLFGVK